jgi:Transposase DDE domain
VKGRPLSQIGLAVTQEEGLPLFHKVFDGDVHDSSTLRDLVTMFGSYRLGPGLFVYDRGILSKRNVKDIKDLRWDTLCGVPLNPALKRSGALGPIRSACCNSQPRPGGFDRLLHFPAPLPNRWRARQTGALPQ